MQSLFDHCRPSNNIKKEEFQIKEVQILIQIWSNNGGYKEEIATHQVSAKLKDKF